MSVDNHKRSVGKIVFFIVSILVVLILVLGYSGYSFYTESLEPVQESSAETIEIEIPMGSSRTDIAKILEEEEMIKNASAFNIYVRINNVTGFKAGYYEFSQSMSVEEIVEKLQEGGDPISQADIATIAIPEGITVKEISERLAKDTLFSDTEIMEKMTDESFLNQKLAEFPDLLTDVMENEEQVYYVLEGYLFPATYEYHKEMELEELLTSMLNKTNNILNDYYKTIKNSEWTVHEVLTLASLIEREGISYEDRQKIADVFYNRMEIGMPLQTDVSVTYALGEHQERISLNDLEVESEYNLYVHNGIGPGPVNNPSEDAIRATLNPVDTDYLYFLADLQTREVYFSETYQQHLEYKAEYLD
ncbi:endolytic transglycosylase MltG [Lacticigenium naphthae]|uniref:endolytic transglycosylase MltG n=1 Tax=Lacticigenium naphthae TaxID=515351 RepID=UPI000426E938|nr:endolytic transglycosylase MltG [Lacticigenium naphthae]